MCGCTMGVQCPLKPEEGFQSSGSEITGGCELPCGQWELNPGLCKNSQCPKFLSHFSSPDFRSLNMVGVHYTTTASSDLVIVNVWCGQSFFLLWISLALGWPLQSSGIHFLTLSLLLHFVLPVWCHFLRPNLIRLPSPNTCSSTCSNTSFVF